MPECFFRRTCRLWCNVEKYCRAGQATDDNIEHAHCMLHNYGYKHKLKIRYVILVFQLQQWLQVRASMSRYTYTACLVTLRFRPVFWLQNMTHLLFSSLLDDRKLNSKTLMTAPIRRHSTVYQNQRNNACTYYGCLKLNHRIKRRLTEHVRWYYQPRWTCPRYISTLSVKL